MLDPSDGTMQSAGQKLAEAFFLPCRQLEHSVDREPDMTELVRRGAKKQRFGDASKDRNASYLRFSPNVPPVPEHANRDA